MAKEITHCDMLGNPIHVGDIVAFPTSNELRLGAVTKLSPKMISVSKLKKSKARSDTGPERKYPSDTLVVNDPRLTIYMLKHSAD